MADHHVYPDELNERGNKTRNGKNKRLAQELGIVIAKDMFESYLDVENQGTLFSWNFYGPTAARHASVQLPLCYRHKMKNIQELKAIAHEAALIEWSNLVASHDSLPKAHYTYEELISAFSYHFTSRVINHLLRDYKKSLSFDVTAANEDSVQTAFMNQLDIEKTRKDSIIEIEKRIVDQFEVNDQEKAKFTLLKHVNEFFDKF